jgi:hypothetical protein
MNCRFLIGSIWNTLHISLQYLPGDGPFYTKYIAIDYLPHRYQVISILFN